MDHSYVKLLIEENESLGARIDHLEYLLEEKNSLFIETLATLENSNSRNFDLILGACFSVKEGN